MLKNQNDLSSCKVNCYGKAIIFKNGHNFRELRPVTRHNKVIITAGASGIGFETAKEFINGGAKVAVCDIDSEALEAAKRNLPGLLTYFCDVSKPEETKTFIENAAKQLHGIDTLVNNAGIGGPTKKIEDITPEEWNNCIDICLGGQFNCISSTVKYLKESNNPSIINLSSAAGRMGFALRTPYSAAKWGVIGLSKSLAIELGEYGVRVNAVLPGVVSGKRQEKILKSKAAARNISYEEVEAEALSFASIKQYVSPLDIAKQIVFLASDSGKMISGQAISVCGDLKMLS